MVEALNEKPKNRTLRRNRKIITPKTAVYLAKK
jgi:hypothetical protein